MRKHFPILLLAILAIVSTISLALVSTPTSTQQPAPPEPAPLAKVDFPRYETRRLPNGLTVYAIQHTEQPVVAIRLLIAAGAANDPEDMPGVASFTANLLNQGTRTRSATQIAEAIDEVGGSLEASADMESTVVSAGILKDNIPLAFELMTDIVMNPAFADPEIQRLRQQTLSGLAASMEEPDFIADAVFQRLIYGNHPYSHLEGGTLESVPVINREHLVRFHETFYAPNISALAIVGDLPTSESFKLAEQWFGSWKAREIPRTSPGNPPALQGRQIVVVDKPDAVQTEIRVGHLGVPRKDSDYFNVLIASYVLGGSAQSRLNRTLRVERGLTYGAYATIVPRRGPGSFYSVTDTRTEKTVEALDLIYGEVDKLQMSDVPADELRDAKAYIIGGFPLTIELPSDLATRLTTVFLYDLGDDYLATYRDRLAAVSAAAVLRVSREKISSNNVGVVLVGNAQGFQESLKDRGRVRVIPAEQLNLDSPISTETP